MRSSEAWIRNRERSRSSSFSTIFTILRETMNVYLPKAKSNLPSKPLKHIRTPWRKSKLTPEIEPHKYLSPFCVHDLLVRIHYNNQSIAKYTKKSANRKYLIFSHKISCEMSLLSITQIRILNKEYVFACWVGDLPGKCLDFFTSRNVLDLEIFLERLSSNSGDCTKHLHSVFSKKLFRKMPWNLEITRFWNETAFSVLGTTVQWESLKQLNESLKVFK